MINSVSFYTEITLSCFCRKLFIRFVVRTTAYFASNSRKLPPCVCLLIVDNASIRIVFLSQISKINYSKGLLKGRDPFTYFVLKVTVAKNKKESKSALFVYIFTLYFSILIMKKTLGQSCKNGLKVSF